MKAITAYIDVLSNRLEAKGYLKEAEELDVIANTFEAASNNKPVHVDIISFSEIAGTPQADMIFDARTGISFEFEGRKKCRVSNIHFTTVEIQDMASDQFITVFNREFMKAKIWRNIERSKKDS